MSMTKRKLSRRQLWRIQKIQEERRSRAGRKRLSAEEEERLQSHLGPEQYGLVVAYHGSSVEIEDESRQVHPCKLRQNLEPLVTGDRVIWRPLKDGSGVVVARNERRSALTRPDASGRMKSVAANIDKVFVVVAPVPALVLGMLDRYLIAVETLHLKPIILVNKVDLLDQAGRKEMEQALHLYKQLGYSILYVSAETRHGLDELNQSLEKQVSVFVGQSGVGKSSIITSILPDVEIAVSAVSAKGKGRHTTTTARLYHLPSGGDLIDSPGIREFGLWHMSPDEVYRGFIELQPLLGECRFRNCEHDAEPGCVVQKALAEGKISAQRMQSCRRIIASLLNES